MCRFPRPRGPISPVLRRKFCEAARSGVIVSARPMLSTGGRLLLTASTRRTAHVEPPRPEFAWPVGGKEAPALSEDRERRRLFRHFTASGCAVGGARSLGCRRRRSTTPKPPHAHRIRMQAPTPPKSEASVSLCPSGSGEWSYPGQPVAFVRGLSHGAVFPTQRSAWPERLTSLSCESAVSRPQARADSPIQVVQKHTQTATVAAVGRNARRFDLGLFTTTCPPRQGARSSRARS